MSASASSAPTTAAVYGPRWSARAGDWSDLAAGISMPAWEAVADATAVGPRTRVLDIGGSGEFCRLAAARGAAVSGIDATEGMIAVARRHVPGADLRVGAMERLPWDDAMFDVVTGFNALQFAADILAALAEARRVARPGGRIAICNWSQPDDSDLFTVLAPLRALQPPPEPSPPPPTPPAIGKPGILERLARQARLEPISSAEVDIPFQAPDQRTLERALLASGGATLAIEHSGEDAVRAALVEAAAPFQHPDGVYRFKNRFTYVITHPSSSAVA